MIAFLLCSLFVVAAFALGTRAETHHRAGTSELADSFARSAAFCLGLGVFGLTALAVLR